MRFVDLPLYRETIIFHVANHIRVLIVHLNKHFLQRRRSQNLRCPFQNIELSAINVNLQMSGIKVIAG